MFHSYHVRWGKSDSVVAHYINDNIENDELYRYFKCNLTNIATIYCPLLPFLRLKLFSALLEKKCRSFHHCRPYKVMSKKLRKKKTESIKSNLRDISFYVTTKVKCSNLSSCSLGTSSEGWDRAFPLYVPLLVCFCDRCCWPTNSNEYDANLQFM